MSGVKACLYDNVRTQGRGYEPRALNPVGGAEHARGILRKSIDDPPAKRHQFLTGVKTGSKGKA